MRQAKAYGRMIKHEEPPYTTINPAHDKARSAKMNRIVEMNNTLRTKAERIAQDKFHYRNYLFTDIFKKHEANGGKFATVDKYYPFAKGGPLAVDEPETQAEVNFSKSKLGIYKLHGIRFLILWKSITDEEIYEQLGDAQ